MEQIPLKYDICLAGHKVLRMLWEPKAQKIQLPHCILSHLYPVCTFTPEFHYNRFVAVLFPTSSSPQVVSSLQVLYAFMICSLSCPSEHAWFYHLNNL